MMSTNAERAINLVVLLAQHSASPVTSVQIEQALHVPTGSLSDIINHLHKAQIIQTPRGPLGGYSLLRRPESLTFYDIIRAIDDARDSQRLSVVDAAPMHPLHDARTQLDATYRATTIAQYMRD